MKSLTLIFILNFLVLPAMAGSTIYCSHLELCKMLDLIANQNKMVNFQTQVLVNISGDPHEYEPSAAEIKNLINAPILLTGPSELNPWIKKIIFQRSKTSGTKTIALNFGPLDYQLYPMASGDALSHFWIYPKIYCSLKSKLEAELKGLNYKIITSAVCDSQTIEKKLEAILAKIKRPIILTHDALLPLMLSLKNNNTYPIVSIKGSGHHEETSAQSIKKMYDVLKAPQVIWIKELGINVPSNILNKIRSNDKVIQIDTAKSMNTNPFSVLNELSIKLNQLEEK